jgi:hypothetical protein
LIGWGMNGGVSTRFPLGGLGPPATEARNIGNVTSCCVSMLKLIALKIAGEPAKLVSTSTELNSVA